jgi:hypothetical protein
LKFSLNVDCVKKVLLAELKKKKKTKKKALVFVASRKVNI